MTVADELLAQCLATPDDDASRLVWADAIGGERGELVGLQCGRDAVSAAELVLRNRRERELLATHAKAWSGLDGLARRVRFRRGFVDAIEVDTDTWLAHADRIVARAPFVTSLSVTSLHPTYTTREGRAEARQRLAHVVEVPAFAQIRALEICDHITELEYEWGDAAAAVLASTGTLARLTALALPHRFTDAGIPSLIDGEPRHLTRLWLRESLLRPARTTALARAMPALDELDLRAARLDFELIATGWPRLTSLRLRAVTADDVVRLATSPLASQLERLVLDPGDRRDRLGPEHVVRLASLSRLRALELDGELGEDFETLRALATVELPALSELRLAWTPSRVGLDAVVRRFGAQLELLDLRASQRIDAIPSTTCDVLVDEPRELELLQVGPADRASWRVAGEVHAVGAPIDTAAWLVDETGPTPGRVWELGMLGDRRIRIGRTAMCEVVLRDGSIARTHAVLDWRDGGHHVRDLGSTNGVVIAGRRVDQEVLRDGARFRLGRVVLRYFVGPGGGERATACVRMLATTDPVTGLVRQTSPDAARIAVADLAAMIARHGTVAVDVVIAVLGRRLCEAASPNVVVTAPVHGEFGVHPATAAAMLVEAVSAPVDAEGELVPVRLTVA